MTGSDSNTRRAHGRDATYIALIEAAEMLFGQSGVDGVTTREIQEAAGSANKNVISYYFGSKEALVNAIYRHRMPAMEARRAELLEALDRSGTGKDLAALLDAHYRPLLEQTDVHGRHSYSRFLSALHSGWGHTRLNVRQDYQVTETLVRRMKELLPASVAGRLEHRLRIVYMMIAAALRIIDEHQAEHALSAHHLFSEAVHMAAAALRAPLDPTTENPPR
ncbi:transcriptional regulator, TetR family [Sphingomonas sp. YR710]|jgi:AcrR family transcriptional regulator|uniref:TetR/AcrR family transcriptional regulator n=1 Tax=Sphingomonas sp. YR710 TaxID=1882773 RepID=UPI00087F41D7|nr:TetR/AcrR family transcriptional regulator [Sphingomonas sp. YR710]SDD74994.1 transcriptional regulator, TetR family [Sphingomonas sp. YR710]